MRRGWARAIAALTVAALTGAAAGCGGDEPPEMPASPVFAPQVQQQLAGLFPVRATEVGYQFPVNIDEPLQHVHAGWAQYLQQLQIYLRFAGVEGRLVKAIEDDGSATYDAVCQVQTLPSPMPTSLERPLYCRTVEVAPNAVPQTGLVILPVGFTERLREVVASMGEQDKRLVAGIIASLYYLDHLKQEAANAGIVWPRGDLFDWCLVGVGMRSLTKATIVEDQLRRLFKAVADLIGEPPPPIGPTQQHFMMKEGYTNGRPETCVYDYTVVPR
jgi:hypothetical protein